MITFEKLKADYKELWPYSPSNISLAKVINEDKYILSYVHPSSDRWCRIPICEATKSLVHFKAPNLFTLQDRRVHDFLLEYCGIVCSPIKDPNKMGFEWTIIDRGTHIVISSYLGVYIYDNRRIQAEIPSLQIVRDPSKDEELQAQIKKVRIELISRFRFGTFDKSPEIYRVYTDADIYDALFAATPEDWKSYLPLIDAAGLQGSTDPAKEYDDFMQQKLNSLRLFHKAVEYVPENDFGNVYYFNF